MDSTVRNAEMTSDSSICAANERRTPRASRLPTQLAVMTLNPAVQPKANCRKMKVSGNVSLTPATCSAVSTCPQMMASVRV